MSAHKGTLGSPGREGASAGQGLGTAFAWSCQGKNPPALPVAGGGGAWAEPGWLSCSFIRGARAHLEAPGAAAPGWVQGAGHHEPAACHAPGSGNLGRDPGCSLCLSLNLSVPFLVTRSLETQFPWQSSSWATARATPARHEA